MQSKRKKREEDNLIENAPYDVGEISTSCIKEIGKQIVHRLAVGHADISGQDFGGILAKAVNGEHRLKPLGLADVTSGTCAWLTKTVKKDNPFTTKKTDLIFGRNSLETSFQIQNSNSDVQKAGSSVLKVWNKRHTKAKSDFDELRVFVMLRSPDLRRFVFFEYETPRFQPGDFYWNQNGKGNLQGFHKESDEHRFRWQPRGSQFTHKVSVPTSAVKLELLRRPKVIEIQRVIDWVEYKDSWLKIETLDRKN